MYFGIDYFHFIDCLFSICSLYKVVEVMNLFDDRNKPIESFTIISWLYWTTHHLKNKLHKQQLSFNNIHKNSFPFRCRSCIVRSHWISCTKQTKWVQIELISISAKFNHAMNSNILNRCCLHLQGICKIIVCCCCCCCNYLLFRHFFSCSLIIIRNELLAEYRMSYLLSFEYVNSNCVFAFRIETARGACK